MVENICWLDDVVAPPVDDGKTYVWVRSAEDMPEYAGDFDAWSLDYDLGGQPAECGGEYDYSVKTGWDFLKMWDESGKPFPSRIELHTMNPNGLLGMVQKLIEIIYERKLEHVVVTIKPSWRVH